VELNQQVPAGSRQLIERYGVGSFRVSGRRFEGSILVLPQATEAWSVASFDDLSLNSLQPVIAADPSIEVLIIGCGPALARLPLTLREVMRAKSIGIEAMDTRAACRTYNVLASEGRRAAAALIAL